MFNLLTLCALTAAKMSDASWFYNQETPLLFSSGSGQFPESSLVAISDAYLNGADFIDITL